MALLFAHYLCISTPLLIIGIIAQSAYSSAWVFNTLVCIACSICSYFLWHTQRLRKFCHHPCFAQGFLLRWSYGGHVAGRSKSFKRRSILRGNRDSWLSLYAHQWHQLEKFHNFLPKKTPYALRGTIEDIALTEHLWTPTSYHATPSGSRHKAMRCTRSRMSDIAIIYA